MAEERVGALFRNAILKLLPAETLPYAKPIED